MFCKNAVLGKKRALAAGFGKGRPGRSLSGPPHRTTLASMIGLGVPAHVRRGVGPRVCLLLGALFVVLLGGAEVRASHQLPGNGEQIETSNYALDLYQGPVFADTRVTGLGGAYVAVSEDVGGNLHNPASPAVRRFHSVDPFDFSAGLGLTFPFTLRRMDFFNTGSRTELQNSPTSFVFLTPALNLQFGTFGLGLTFEYQSYSLARQGGEGLNFTRGVPSMRSLITTTHVQAANAFFDGQLVAGLGGRIVVLRVDNRAILSTPFDVPFSTVGTGLEFGVLWRPAFQPFRLGASFRTPIEADAAFSREYLPDETGHIAVEVENTDFYLPERVEVPWDLNVGAALQFGREFNAPWRTVDDVAEKEVLEHRLRQIEREEEYRQRRREATSPHQRAQLEHQLRREQRRDDRRLERKRRVARRALERVTTGRQTFYALLSGSLLITGGAESAVGIESFLAQRVNRAHDELLLSPRLGVETELWPEAMRVRVGNYLEPGRYSTSRARVHQTLGADIRLPVWSVFGIAPRDFRWKVSTAVDAARDYLVWGISLGGWYPRHSRDDVHARQHGHPRRPTHD